MILSCLRPKLLLAMTVGVAACSASNLTGSNGSDGGSSGGLNQGTRDGGDAGNGGGCPQGQTSCLGACADTQTDTSNCGTCGALCGNGQNCLAGVCTCPAGGTVCGNSCTSLATDDHNCGSCNHACGAGQTCSDGGCTGDTPDAGYVDGGGGLNDAGPDAGYDGGTGDGGTSCTLANLTFAIAAYPAGKQPVALAIGHLRDAGLDVVVANLSSNTGGVFLNIGNGRFGAQQTFTTDQGPAGVALADFNGDGLVDVVLSATTANTVDVRFGNGDGTFAAQTSYPVDDGPSGLAVAEFVPKARPGLAVACGFGSDVDVLLNLGDGGLGPAVAYDDAGYGPAAVLAADLTGNGTLDLAVVNSANGGGLDILIGNGNGTFLPQIETPLALQGAALVTDDFNGDHKPDIAVAYYGYLDEMGNEPTNELAVYLGNGNGSFQPPTTYPTTDTPFGLATGDLNGDGIPDLIAAEVNGDVGIFLGNGDGTFQPEHLVVAGTGLAAAVVGDLDGDGKLDIAVADEGGNALVVLLNRCP